jgi:pyrroline-5-carboxylate reductase
LIRKDNQTTKTYRFDISSIQNTTAAEVFVRNHDIVVVNYYPRKVQSALKEINPWLNLSTAALAVISIIIRLTP